MSVPWFQYFIMSIVQAIVYSDVCSLLTREKANVAFNDKAFKGFLFKGKQ